MIPRKREGEPMTVSYTVGVAISGTGQFHEKVAFEYEGELVLVASSAGSIELDVGRSSIFKSLALSSI